MLITNKITTIFFANRSIFMKMNIIFYYKNFNFREIIRDEIRSTQISFSNDINLSEFPNWTGKLLQRCNIGQFPSVCITIILR